MLMTIFHLLIGQPSVAITETMKEIAAEADKKKSKDQKSSGERNA